MQLEPGDILVLYTDGVTETLNPAREQFSFERLVKVILENGHRSPAELLGAILDSTREFSEGQAQNDDITIMIVQV